MSNTEKRWASPEWVVSNRGDAQLVPTLQRGWSVGQAPLLRGASFTDFGSHRMSVPYGDETKAVAVRVHELLHASMSPASVPAELLRQLTVSPEAVGLAEEVRVNFVATLMAHDRSEPWEGITNLSDGSEVKSAQDAVERNDWRAGLSVFLATLGSDVHGKVKRRLRTNPEWKDGLTAIEKHLKVRGLWAGDRRVKSGSLGYRTHYVSDTRPVEYRYREGATVGKVREARVVLPNGFIDTTLPLAHAIDEWMASPPSDAPKKREEVGAHWARPHRDGARWRDLHVGMTSLTETTGTFLGRRRRPSVVGKAPRRPDRLLTDPERRIFSETVRGKGGVVVFDCSGSMRVNWDTVHEVVREYSGATVIAYSGQGRDTANAWVLAKDGRMIGASEMSGLPLGRGNEVDGPVLRWALRYRKSPKDFFLWVTDGGVTGDGDGFSKHLVVECARLCRAKGIITVENATSAIELLRESKRRGGFPTDRHVPQIRHALDQIGLGGDE